ncbi:MAG: DUF2232 domain-containing protein [Pseudomonadota bacterium]
MTNQTAKSSPNIWAIGIAAGAATFLLVLLSGVGGGVIALVVPLPGLVVGLAYGWPVAALAGLVGASMTFLFSQGSGIAGLAYAVVVALPVVLLAHLTGAWRTPDGRLVDSFKAHPATIDGVDPRDPGVWLSPSSLLTAIVFIAVALASMMTLAFGVDDTRYTANVHEALDSLLDTRLAPGLREQLTPDQLGSLKEGVALVLPAAAAIGWMLAMCLNLWLAGRITAARGLLARPVPPLRETALPRILLFGLGIALIVINLGGAPGRVAIAFAGAAVFALVLIGLAVIHEWSLGRSARAFILGIIYAGLLFVGHLVAPFLAALAIADFAFGFRPRLRARRVSSGPPPPLAPGQD